MDTESIKIFGIGIMLGTLLGGYFGFQIGKKMTTGVWSKPEFKIVLASVALTLWATAQLMGIVFQTPVDPWLNGIMGIITGFFFGDGVMEKIGKK